MTNARLGGHRDGRRDEAAGQATFTVPRTPDETPISLPRPSAWAAGFIAAGGADVPTYGSAEWASLPANSPARVAACVRAAEAWRTYWDPDECARRLRVELKAVEDDDETWPAELVEQVHRSASRPSFADLCERRGEPEAKARAVSHRHRLGLSVGDGPQLHTDGRPVHYQRTRPQHLRAVVRD